MPTASRWSACLVPLALCACEPAPPAQRVVAPVTAATPRTAPAPAEAPAPGVMEGAPTARLASLSVDADGTLRDGAGKLYAHATTTCMIFPAKG